MTSVDSPFFGKRVLLLQGPVGPFFSNLAQDLRRAGAEVFKVNFNAGDWLFYPRQAHNFKGSLHEWHEELPKFLQKHQINAVLVFGDCRPVHAQVRALAESLGIAVGVFEEGYLRPDYVTFEPVGVNGHSVFHQDLAEWLKLQATLKVPRAANADVAELPSPGEPSHGSATKPALPKMPPHQAVGNCYWSAARWGMLYFFASWAGYLFWNNSLHHRPLTIWDGLWWLLSFARKAYFKRTEKGIQEKLEGELRRKFFLVPLQVHNDAQITVHSDYESVCGFIDHVMRSFAGALLRENQPEKQLPLNAESIQGDVLVFKHHPMDRGHRNYSKVVRLLTRRHGLEGRVFYIHDQHLPSLLKACKGVVLVNSTTGLSALGHAAPVKVCGSALYDVPGLTFQGRLNDFWFEARSALPSAEVLQRFKAALVGRTQLNGSFYRKLPNVQWRCGVRLQGLMALRLWPEPVVTVLPEVLNKLASNQANAAAPVSLPAPVSASSRASGRRGKRKRAAGKVSAL
jgi:capsular polysaccharide export protein